jgi:hypothetical protein
MRYAHKLHTCLTGVTPNGTLFLLDVGVLKGCHTISGSKHKIVSKANKDNKAVPSQVLTPEGIGYYKVQPLILIAVLMVQSKDNDSFMEMVFSSEKEYFRRVIAPLAPRTEHVLLIRYIF